MTTFTKKEKKLVLLCFCAYTAAYVCRTNLSPVLGKIQEELKLTAAEIGLLPTLFAIPYGLGQIFSGILAERWRPYSMMALGLLGSAATNELFSLSASYKGLLVLWFINGCFQSMIWTPVFRVFETQLRKEVRDRAMFLISISLILGYLAAWLLTGLITSALNWRRAFRVSGFVTGIAAVICETLICRNYNRELVSEKKTNNKENTVPLTKILLRPDILLITLCCVLNGYVRDGIMNWAPKILTDLSGFDLGGTLGVLLIIPVVNYFGISGGRLVYRKTGGDVERTSSLIMLTCAMVSALLCVFSFSGILLYAVLLALISATAYALNPILTGILPLSYRDIGHMTFLAGLTDAAVYMGSALSGAAAGGLIDLAGWRGVFFSWCLLSLAGTGMIRIAGRKVR